MPLLVAQVGDPVLRQLARPLSIGELRGPEIRRLIEEMREAMRAAPGVGLAAPQVGYAVQLLVVEDRADYHQDVPPDQLLARERKPVPFQVLINPEIVWQSDETKVFFEGCLSLAGFAAIVPRARSVRVTYLDQHASPRSVDATGWYARILQHEVDHLQGGLYIDRMESRSFTSLDNLARHWKNLPPAELLAKLE